MRSLILAEFPRGIEVQRDYDISIPDFRGDREQRVDVADDQTVDGVVEPGAE